jgi:hypothetical protein
MENEVWKSRLQIQAYGEKLQASLQERRTAVLYKPNPYIRKLAMHIQLTSSIQA